MKFSIKTLGFSNEDNFGVSKRKYPTTPYAHFQIHRVNSSGKAIGKARDSPTSSILKTPTAIFVTTRNSSNRTKRLKFANGPMNSENLRNGSVESNDSNADSVEVAISPKETMQVSLDAWNAFLEYRKFNDYSNETEKTDYTYSKFSKFRHKEIIPGFIIRPNMSRPPLSSIRSSMSSSQSSTPSFTESFNYDDYENSVCKKEYTTEVSYDFKTPKQSNTTNRSKYYLRSSNLGVEESNKMEDSRSTQNSKNLFSRSPRNSSYFLSETNSSSFPNSYSESILTSPSFSYSPEKMSMNYLNSESETKERSSPYHAKIRSMNLDDTDIDEVDVYDQNYSSSKIQPRVFYQAQLKPQQNRSLSQGVKNLFTSLFLYVTTIGTFTKDLFSKYILRRKNDYSYTPYDGKWEKYRGNTLSSESWLQGFGNKNKYYSPSYYSGQYYGQPRSWYQRLYYYFQSCFSSASNMLWGGSPNYGVEPTPRKRKFWWLLIPLLLLGGAFLGGIDFFSDPKAILNTMFDGVLFVSSFLKYAVMVFIPHFLTVTIPGFFFTTVLPYMKGCVHFLTNLSIASVWALVLGAFNFGSRLFISNGQLLLNTLYTIVTTICLFSLEYLTLFYSNFCTMFFALLTNTFNCVLWSFEIFNNALHYFWGLVK